MTALVLRLVEVKDDPLIPWQWWAEGETQDDLPYAGARYMRMAKTHTYVAGFATKAAADAYGRNNGWNTKGTP